MLKHRALAALLLGFAATILAVVPAHAEPLQRANKMVPISAVVFVSCANGGGGENVALTGTAHVIEYYTVDDGGGFHFTYRVQSRMRGVGQTSGESYRGVSVDFETLHQRDQGTQVFTSAGHVSFHGVGTGDHFLVHYVAHHTMSESGVKTSSFSFQSVECR